MKEQWKPIDGVEGYEVSDHGRVRNLGGQVVACGKPGGVRVIPQRILKPFKVNSTGYMQVQLPNRRRHFVHRLVAAAFCEGRAPGMVVDHINCVKSDNRATNLRWLSNGENCARPYRETGMHGWARGKTGDQSTKKTAIVAMCLATGEVRNFACASDAVRDLGLDSGGISKCCYGLQASHKGWKVQFAGGVSGFPHKRNRVGQEGAQQGVRFSAPDYREAA